MPVPVACGNCPAKLTAPDHLAGKRVKCPKCGTPILVPAADDDAGFEVVDTPPPKSAKPAVKPRPRDDDVEDRPRKKPTRARVADDDDEEDDDDRPRRKTKKAAGGIPVWVWPAAAATVVGLGVGGYFILNSKSDPSGPAAGGAPGVPAAAWVQFTDPAGAFAASFPVAPQKEDAAAIADDAAAGTGSGRNAPDPQQFEAAKKLLRDTMTEIDAYRWVAPDGGRRYFVQVMKLDKGLMAAIPPETLLEGLSKQSLQFGGKIADDRKTTFAGRPAHALTWTSPTGRTQILRAFVTGKTMVLVAVEANVALSPTDSVAQKFFDGFENKLQ